MKITIQFFAQLRSQAGVDRVVTDTSATSLSELWDELAARHRLSAERQVLKVALNGRYADWGTAIPEGATVVFIPPVAGG